MGLVDVLLHNVAMLGFTVGVLLTLNFVDNVVHIFGEKDTCALRKRIRFDNVGYSSLGVREIIAQLNLLAGQNKGLGEKVVVMWKLFVHAHKVLGEVVFLSDALDARIHVDFLVQL